MERTRQDRFSKKTEKSKGSNAQAQLGFGLVILPDVCFPHHRHLSDFGGKATRNKILTYIEIGQCRQQTDFGCYGSGPSKSLFVRDGRFSNSINSPIPVLAFQTNLPTPKSKPNIES
jgi:hypothetical protein